MKKLSAALLTAILVLTTGTLLAKGDKPGPKRTMVENSAPDFEMKDLSGKTVTL
jgi:hypothetical protein